MLCTQAFTCCLKAEVHKQDLHFRAWPGCCTPSVHHELCFRESAWEAWGVQTEGDLPAPQPERLREDVWPADRTVAQTGWENLEKGWKGVLKKSAEWNNELMLMLLEAPAQGLQQISHELILFNSKKSSKDFGIDPRSWNNTSFQQSFQGWDLSNRVFNKFLLISIFIVIGKPPRILE